MILPQGKRGKMMDNSNKAQYTGPERRSQVAEEQEVITTRELVELSLMVKQLIVKVDDLSSEFKHYKKEHDEEDSAKLANMERMYRKADTDIAMLREDVKTLKDWKKALEDKDKTGLGAKIKGQFVIVLTTLATTGAVSWIIWNVMEYLKAQGG